MKTTNNNVAVQALVIKKEQAKVVRGLDMDDGQTNHLIGTMVLIDSEKYKKGTVLYFRADAVRLPQAKAKFKLDDQEFVLMPEELVLAFDDSKITNLKSGEEYHP